MKPVAKLIILLATLFALTQGVIAQNITGQYYGIGNVTKDGNYSQYLTELILVQKGNSVTGEFNYYFKRSHITAKVKGEFNSNTRLLKLHLVPLLNYKAVNNIGADCPMQGYFVLRVAKAETTLSGEFEAIDAYKYTCPSIFIKLKKELPTPEEQTMMEIAREAEAKTNEFDSLTTTKFAADTTTNLIIEPGGPVITSRWNKPVVKKTTAKTTQKKTPTTLKTVASKQEVSKPSPFKEDELEAKTNNKKIDSTRSIVISTQPQAKSATPIVKSTEPAKQAQVGNKDQSTVAVTKPAIIKVAPPKPTPIVLKPEEIAITKDLLKRTFEESAVIEVEADSLFMELYDNGEVDGDTVAVFHNRKLMLSKQGLSTKPIKLVVPIDTTTQEISMYAENLGIIPPNTAICIIMAGGKRYELTLTSTFIRNGTIRFRKKTQAQIEREKKYL